MLSGERSVAECFEHNGFAPPEGDVAMVVWHEDSAAPAAALDGLWPVSYTHLDVYKRQMIF